MDTFNASHENTFFAMSTWFQNILFKENEKIQLQNSTMRWMLPWKMKNNIDNN